MKTKLPNPLPKLTVRRLSGGGLLLAMGLALSACQSGTAGLRRGESSASITNAIREFQAAIPAEVVSQRTRAGNWRFLAYSGGAMEATFVPGLTPDEVKQFIDSGRYTIEVFYAFHATFELGKPDEVRALADARLEYASRVNRQLIEEIRRRIDSEDGRS